MKCFALILIFFIHHGLHSSVESSGRERRIEEKMRLTLESEPALLGNINAKPGKGVLQVYQKIYNMVVTGVSAATLKYVKADLRAGFLYMAYNADRLKAYVDYELDGYCLLIPIWGKGKGLVVMDDVRVRINATVGGRFKITKVKITYDVSGGSFDLESLFDEPQPRLLTRLYMKVFNENAKFIFNEILEQHVPQSERFIKVAWETFMALS